MSSYMDLELHYHILSQMSIRCKIISLHNAYAALCFLCVDVIIQINTSAGTMLYKICIMTGTRKFLCPDLRPHAAVQLGAINLASSLANSHIPKSPCEWVCVSGCDGWIHAQRSQSTIASNSLSFFPKFSQYFICKFNIQQHLLQIITQTIMWCFRVPSP